MPQSPWSTTREAAVMRIPCIATREYPLLEAIGESPHAAMKTWHSQKMNKQMNKQTFLKVGNTKAFHFSEESTY